MLEITLPASVDLFNGTAQEFVPYVPRPRVLVLEHSLVSVSKWESRFKKPFLTTSKKTDREALEYVKFMTLTQNVDDMVYMCLTAEDYAAVGYYIEDSMTATTFAKDTNHKINREIVTAEIIYYWMIVLQIPMECQKWHLNRLLTLINVCNLKNKPPKKMTRAEIIARNRELNAQRHKATRG